MTTGVSANAMSVSEGKIYETEYLLDYADRGGVLPQLCKQGGYVSGSGEVIFSIVPDDASTTERGRNGDIVYNNGGRTTVTAVLKEALGAEQIDNFSAFKSSINERNAMYERVSNAVKRREDDYVLEQLDATSNVYNSGTAISLTEVNLFTLIAEFREQIKGVGGQTVCVLTEKAFTQLGRLEKVSSRDYVNELKLDGGRRPFRWQDIIWVPHPRLTGAGGATAKNFMFHSSAVMYHSAGAAQFRMPFDEVNLKWKCNAQKFVAAKLALPTGVLEWVHDDTAALPT